MNMYVTIRRRNGNPSPPKRKIPNRSCQGEREQQREGECPEIKCSQRGSLEQTRKTEREPSANLNRISGIAMGSQGSWLDLQRSANYTICSLASATTQRSPRAVSHGIRRTSPCYT